VNLKCSTFIGDGTKIGQESVTGKFGGINTVITGSTIGTHVLVFFFYYSVAYEFSWIFFLFSVLRLKIICVRGFTP
jgi:hypothetical protein